ncbi:Arabinosyltransferase ARAD1 [Actinidia chinensis var. chinensis]|uniref:Arabinosyltransferase ARAD1 n=1 Tax=Actinidia chinensis var. chinensis TaxID=1590841 RepID=A0A2R6PE36_ACTCC|nr:Arabinosyltransferase ARAD1 [Actinidia chinensis var. chinensis]
MSEKSLLPSRLLFCLITVSMVFLIFSLVFLLQFSDKSFLPSSVFKLILVNNTSVSFKTSSRGEDSKPPLTSSVRTEDVYHRNSDPVMKLGESCDPDHSVLRVYMYELPPEFHFGLLGWKGSGNQTWPDVSNPSQIPPYPGGLNLQHSMEYWLTLDLVSSNSLEMVRSCSAIRVLDSSRADIVFVPFFASVSYNRYSKLRGKEKVSVNRMLQNKLVEFLKGREEWKRSGGKDHLIVAHHPNSMLVARRKLGSAMFVLADFGRYPVEIANIQKDVIAPYKHLVKTIPADKSAPFEGRPILVYFQGAIYRKDGGVIRQELYYLLKDEKDVHFTFGSVQAHGINQAGQGMGSSKFCLNIAGDTPSSNRLFDAIASHCVPVVMSDEIELPFEDVLDYSEFCIFVRASDAVKKGYVLNLLRGISRDKWTGMWERLKQIARHFEYQYPSRPGDSVDMIWEAVSRKMSSVQLTTNRKNRYRRSQLLVKRT